MAAVYSDHCRQVAAVYSDRCGQVAAVYSDHYRQVDLYAVTIVDRFHCTIKTYTFMESIYGETFWSRVVFLYLHTYGLIRRAYGSTAIWTTIDNTVSLNLESHIRRRRGYLNEENGGQR